MFSPTLKFKMSKYIFELFFGFRSFCMWLSQDIGNRVIWRVVADRPMSLWLETEAKDDAGTTFDLSLELGEQMYSPFRSAGYKEVHGVDVDVGVGEEGCANARHARRSEEDELLGWRSVFCFLF